MPATNNVITQILHVYVFLNIYWSTTNNNEYIIFWP